jgi:hypothetical protein
MVLLSTALARLLELAWHLASSTRLPAASLLGYGLGRVVDALTRPDDGEPSLKAVHIENRARMLKIGQQSNVGMKILRHWISAADGYGIPRDALMITSRTSISRKMYKM